MAPGAQLPAGATPALYGFPAHHPLDPLSRVDLDAEKFAEKFADETDGSAERWPRLRSARGAAVVLEPGDALVMTEALVFVPKTRNFSLKGFGPSLRKLQAHVVFDRPWLCERELSLELGWDKIHVGHDVQLQRAFDVV